MKVTHGRISRVEEQGMDKKCIIKRSSDIKTLFHKDKVVVANIYNGNWMKITKEIFDLLQEAEKQQLNIGSFLEGYSPEDQGYLAELFNNLDILGYLGIEKRKQIKLEDVKFKITHRCNLVCKHCIISAHTMEDKEIFSTKAILELLDKIMECAPDTITLTGGEPMVREDFFRILEYIKTKSNCKIGLMTNGTKITRQNAKILKDAISYFDISIDGINEETCSIIRGKNVFSKVIDSINFLKQEGVENIALSMVATPNNTRYESEFKHLCKELNVIPVIRNFEEDGRGAENAEMFETTFSKKEPQKQKRSFDKKHMRKELKVCCCKAGLDAVSIEENGEIKICTLLNKKAIIGNLAEISNLKDTIQNTNIFTTPAYEYFNSLWPEACKFCKDCDVNLFCWTCPHELELHMMGKKDFKETCLGKKEFLSELVWEE